MLRSRVALTDAQRAFEMLEKCTDEDEIRVYWVAAVALARTSIDVLGKIDRLNSPTAKEAVEKNWDKIKKNIAGEHNIFWNFLKPERDVLLHQYEKNAELSLQQFLVTHNGKPVVNDGKTITHTMDFFFLASGPYEGEDGRDILKDALDWVDKQIATVEGAL